ncbi:MAG: polyphenol oxidase family protein [Acidimicrobiales bacterium]
MEIRRRFSERADGDFAVRSEPRALAATRARLAPHPWTWLDQVHGAGVVVVSSPGEWAGQRADASVTSVPSAVLAVQTADCAPVLFRAAGPGPSATPVIGAAHAGWRGLYEGVLEATAAAMRELGATDIAAQLGPCISAAAYEFGERDLTTMALRFGPDVVAATADGAPALDMSVAVRTALRGCRVELDDEPVPCTATALDGEGRPRFFSHRARGDVGRQASVIWIEP